jgi:hypothetical protein
MDQNFVLRPDTTYYSYIQDAPSGNIGATASWNVPSACPSGTIVVNVVPNITTSWSLNGPQPDTRSSASFTYTNWTLGDYSISGVSNLAGYGTPQVTPAQGSIQTLNNGGTITWTIKYPPPTPVISGISNSSCQKLVITWGNVTNETGYQLWRSSSNGSFNFGSGDGWSLIKTLAADTTTYTDLAVSAGNKYWYIVVAQGAGGNAVSSAVQSPLVLACAPNLSNSQKFIYQVNGAAVNNLTVIRAGDTVTFRFTINNANTATDTANINGITDTMSSNFSNPRNAKVDKGSGFTCLNSCNSLAGSPFTIPVTGSLAPGQTWTVQYDATASSTITDLFSNSGTINCAALSDASVSCTTTRQVKFINTTEQPPTFREVGP